MEVIQILYYSVFPDSPRTNYDENSYDLIFIWGFRKLVIAL